MKNSIVLFLASLVVGVSVFAAQPVKPVYSVVVSEQTNANADWAPVVTALKDKYAEKFDVKVVLWKELSDALPALKEQQPTYICFFCAPSEAKPAFVVACHKLTRQLDDDPYTDAIWAILTGFEPADALRIVAAPDMTVTTLCAATEVPLNAFDSGICYDELVKGKVVSKEKGKEIVEKNGAAIDAGARDDISEALVDQVILKSKKTAKEQLDSCPDDRADFIQPWLRAFILQLNVFVHRLRPGAVMLLVLLCEFASAFGAVRDTCTCIEKTEIIVYLRNCSHGRTRVTAAHFLLDGNDNQ